MQRLVAGVLALAIAAGCATQRTTSPPPTPARQPLYAPPADRVLTSTLLDFDSSLDATFIDARSIRLADDPAKPGNHALAIDGSVQLNLTSLTRGRDVGGMWDMFGMRIWSDVETTCDVTVIGPPESPGFPRRFTLAARAWTKVWMDAPRLNSVRLASTSTQTTSESAADRFLVNVSPTTSASHVLIDDVSLAQSHVIVSESNVPKTNERWRVSRRGMLWVASVDDQAIFTLPAPPFAPGGYRVAESDPTRALFTNDAGTSVCIDRTGRLIEDEKAKLDPRVLKVGKAIAENASPARIEVVGNDGRVERSLPGDRDNDGYDERRGCYTVHAVAGRLAVRLTKQNGTVKWPVLEVFDLPPGPVSVWLDGEIIPWAVRAEDGRTIVELPIELERPVEVQIRVK